MYFVFLLVLDFHDLALWCVYRTTLAQLTPESASKKVISERCKSSSFQWTLSGIQLSCACNTFLCHSRIPEQTWNLQTWRLQTWNFQTWNLPQQRTSFGNVIRLDQVLLQSLVSFHGRTGLLISENAIAHVRPMRAAELNNKKMQGIFISNVLAVTTN